MKEPVDKVGMIQINLDMDMPKECHECPFQLKFKDGEADTWYMRRCVIVQRKIEYPRPEWCPLEYVSEGQTTQSMMEGTCLPKEYEAEWIYGEDETGVDGWHCSECNFFEPWFYDFDDDIYFIKRYTYCPKCRRRMTSYTGKLEEAKIIEQKLTSVPTPSYPIGCGGCGPSLVQE